MFVTFEKGDYVKIADNILGVAVNEERAITVSIEKVPNDNNNYHLGNQPICSGDKKASMLIEDIKEIAVSDPVAAKILETIKWTMKKVAEYEKIQREKDLLKTKE